MQLIAQSAELVQHGQAAGRFTAVVDHRRQRSGVFRGVALLCQKYWRQHVKVKTKPVVTYRLRGTAESHSLTLLKTRDLIDISDEPAERGGTNEGFAPTEFVLGGLAACTNVISNKIAKKNGFRIEAMEIEIEARFNLLGVTLQKEVDLVFPEITLRIAVTTSATEEQQQILKSDLPKYCAVSKIIRQSGTNIIDQWQFTKPAA
ncbi:MAG: OsmC family protein [Proteobacteria bacterium]|nr:OsmC family protein [Pseudomonadota bacterium]